MTKEEIIELARDACDKDKEDPFYNGFWTITQEELERFANLVAAKERKRCAMVCEIESDGMVRGSATQLSLRECAEEIRSLK